jgi:beta-lactamase class A
MKLRVFTLLILLSLQLFLFVPKVAAQEIPNSEVTLSQEVYADLAMRHALGHVSVYYFDGNIKDTISINADQNWIPASTIKLYAAMYAFYQVSQGALSLDQSVTITPSNVAASESFPGGYQALSSGDTVSVYRLLDQMITQSDNTAFNTLLDLLDRREVTKYIQDLGLDNSNVGGKLNLNDSQQAAEVTTAGYSANTTTASDYGRAFEMINGGRVPGSKGLFDMLSRQKLNSMLPADLPTNVVVAHKTGELAPYYHDGGIIVGPNKKYVLSVFSSEGEPSLVAHISALIYTGNINLVGANINPPVVSQNAFPPLDPLVAEADGQKVLAATTQNLKTPTVTASNLGITAADLNQSLGTSELPPVIIPADSPLHLLTDVGYKMTELMYPIKSVQDQFSTDILKMNLAEANNLVKRGKASEANTILASVDNQLGTLAKEPTISQNTALQTTLTQVSETRFTILANQFTTATSSQDKIAAIKTIASQAQNASTDLVPNVTAALKQADPAQTPVVGKVVATSVNSVTVQTPAGNEVSVPVDTQVKTRDSAGEDTQTQNPMQIQAGTEVAITPNFVLTNIPADSINPTPVTVVKVDTANNVLVISKDGVPQQIDLTKQTTINGTDTTVSLDQIQPGDVLVVHGEPLPASPSATIASPEDNSESSASSGLQTNSPNNSGGNSGGSESQEQAGQSGSTTNVSTNSAVTTALPVTASSAATKTGITATATTSPTPSTLVKTPSPKPGTTAAPTTTAKPTATPAPTTPPKATTPPKTPTPTAVPAKTSNVIQGTTIQVIQTTTTTTTTKTATPAPSTPAPAKTSAPALAPATAAPPAATPVATPKK